MSLQIKFERSFHPMCITKLLPLFTYNEQNLQRLSVHLNSRFSQIKQIVSVLNLVLDNKGVNFFVAFELK